MDTIVSQALEEYSARHTKPPSALLQEVEAYTVNNCAHAGMLVGAVAGRFLNMLVCVIGARRVLEIGTFTGYSALSMAEALPEGGELICCDIDPDTTKIAQRFFDRSAHGQKITVRLGAALDTIKGLPRAGHLDMVFIDADKENYVNYYEAVLPRLRVGGLIAADNVLWSGRVLDPKADLDRAIVAFNAHVQSDDRVDNVLLSVRDGLMLIRKK